MKIFHINQKYNNFTVNNLKLKPMTIYPPETEEEQKAFEKAYEFWKEQKRKREYSNKISENNRPNYKINCK